MQWDDELPFIGSEMSGFEEAYVSEVIKTCLSLGLFDKNMYDTEQVLTSKGIQARYCNIQRLNKRMSRIDKYSLLDEPQQRTTASKPKTETAKSGEAVTPQAPAQVTPVPPAPTKTNNTEWLREFLPMGRVKTYKCFARTSD